MGMAIGGAKNGPVAEPNIVPLIDVLLVLIIIFMVIAPKVPTGLPVLVPQKPSRQMPEPPESVVVQVLQNGKVMINEEASEWDALGTRLADIFKERADKVAFVKGADDVPFERVARAIDIMRGAGIDQVGLMTARDGIERKVL
jgi:biopolymer transport protein ExbD